MTHLYVWMIKRGYLLYLIQYRVGVFIYFPVTHRLLRKRLGVFFAHLSAHGQWNGLHLLPQSSWFVCVRSLTFFCELCKESWVRTYVVYSSNVIVNSFIFLPPTTFFPQKFESLLHKLRIKCITSCAAKGFSSMNFPMSRFLIQRGCTHLSMCKILKGTLFNLL